MRTKYLKKFTVEEFLATHIGAEIGKCDLLFSKPLETDGEKVHAIFDEYRPYVFHKTFSGDNDYNPGAFFLRPKPSSFYSISGYVSPREYVGFHVNIGIGIYKESPPPGDDEDSILNRILENDDIGYGLVYESGTAMDRIDATFVRDNDDPGHVYLVHVNKFRYDFEAPAVSEPEADALFDELDSYIRAMNEGYTFDFLELKQEFRKRAGADDRNTYSAMGDAIRAENPDRVKDGKGTGIQRLVADPPDAPYPHRTYRIKISPVP